MSRYQIVSNGSLILSSDNLYHALRLRNSLVVQKAYEEVEIIDSDTGEYVDPESITGLSGEGPQPLKRGQKHVSREESITASILRFLNSLKNCKAEKRQGTLTQRDRPDIIGCVSGRFFAFEVKKPSEEATPGQLNNLIKWAEVGAISAVVYSVGDVKDVFDHFGIDWSSNTQYAEKGEEVVSSSGTE